MVEKAAEKGLIIVSGREKRGRKKRQKTENTLSHTYGSVQNDAAPFADTLQAFCQT